MIHDVDLVAKSDFSNHDDMLKLCCERDRILATAEFERSPVMVTLFKYLTDQYLQDPQRPIKSYMIAVDALGRGSDFDPQTDSYPRVQVARLRTLLDKVYSAGPAEFRIRIPKGSYCIEINRKKPAAASAQPLAEEEQQTLRQQITEALGNSSGLRAVEHTSTEEIVDVLTAFHDSKNNLPAEIQATLIETKINKGNIRQMRQHQNMLFILCLVLGVMVVGSTLL